MAPVACSERACLANTTVQTVIWYFRLLDTLVPTEAADGSGCHPHSCLAHVVSEQEAYVDMWEDT